MTTKSRQAIFLSVFPLLISFKLVKNILKVAESARNHLKQTVKPKIELLANLFFYLHCKQ